MQDVEETIEGFYFEDEAVGRQALREYTYIGKMKDRVAALRPEDLKEFYHKLIDKRIFKTQIGYTYLYEIRSTLVDNCHFSDDELEEIVIPAEEVQKEEKPEKAEKLTEEILGLKRTKKLLTAAVVVLLCVIAGFFVILAMNQNIGYINTENKILNKYAGWQEELDAREQALDEREEALKQEQKAPGNDEAE